MKSVFNRAIITSWCWIRCLHSSRWLSNFSFASLSCSRKLPFSSFNLFNSVSAGFSELEEFWADKPVQKIILFVWCVTRARHTGQAVDLRNKQKVHWLDLNYVRNVTWSSANLTSQFCKHSLWNKWPHSVARISLEYELINEFEQMVHVKVIFAICW